jgi:glycosyltransferase involved in cell wall biosynthesis
MLKRGAPVPIVFVMSSFEPGGTESQMIELIRRLDRRRWDVHVASMRRGGRWFDRVQQAAPCETFAVSSFRRAATLGRWRAFARWCQDTQVAVVHAVDFPSNIFGLSAAAFARIPVRIGARRDINPGRTLAQLAAQRAAYACAHVVIANARAAADRLRIEGVPRRKIVIVPNGLDVSRFRPRALAPPLRRVITVANLRPEKGHDVLLEAARLVLARFPDARFELVGDGPERARLVARADALGIAGAVSFLGHTDEVAGQLARADISALPSRTEAFPNAALEAMASGLPVVASAVGGLVELVDDRRTGLLTPAGDATALAGRLCELMADGALGGRLGRAARAAVEARFSFDRMTDGVERVYLAELARRGLMPTSATQLSTAAR